MSLFLESEFWVLIGKGGYARSENLPKAAKVKAAKKEEAPGFVNRRGKGAGAHYAECPDNSDFCYGKGKKGKKDFKGKDAFKGKGKSKQQNQFSNPMLQPPMNLQ